LALSACGQPPVTTAPSPPTPETAPPTDPATAPAPATEPQKPAPTSDPPSPPAPAIPTCHDGVENQNETGVDCGGVCAACPAPPSCTDAIQNQDETGVDCGPSCGGCVGDTCFDIGQGTCATGLYCIDTKCSATPRPTPECSVKGNPGQCLDTSACAALASHVSTAGFCPGPANIECCTKAPNTADNPPTPAGYQLMKQADVTADMTTWAIAILHDTTNYPLFASVLKQFGPLTVLARVQWHPPDFQNSAIHRGVTLYEPVP
jgi:hypothetical protein